MEAAALVAAAAVSTKGKEETRWPSHEAVARVVV